MLPARLRTRIETFRATQSSGISSKASPFNAHVDRFLQGQRGEISVKVLLALSLSLLMAALPTLLASCELHCLSAAVQPAGHPSAANHCAGHGPEREAQPASPKPSGDRHDCSGHAVLAKATALPGLLPGPAPTIALVSLTLPSPAAGNATRAQEPASSPPPSRSSPILRL